MEQRVSQLFSVDNLVALATLAGLEIVLGIDNVVFIAILAGKLPVAQQDRARKVGLALAMFTRIALLLAIGWVMGLTQPLFEIPRFWSSAVGDAHGVSGRDLILLVGGLFLIAKATHEIHDKLEGPEEETGTGKPSRARSFGGVVFQIILIDIVFSLDSVITAVGMVGASGQERWVNLTIMITAVVLSVFVMLLFSGTISAFIARHPTMKILALSFLILIGVVLVAEGFHAHISKGYIYFAMAFSLVVEIINLRLQKVTKPVQLHQKYHPDPDRSEAS
jgi:predicted tellurium resistance membrane protein TerC